MTAFRLSDEQLRAISKPGNLRVRASAGSGKTEVLARRFVAYMAGDIEGAPPLEPSAIAAITFTEKASDDMRGRIAAVLDEYIAAATAEEVRSQRLRRARRLLPLARISTIHGFCSRIMRENPLEAGIDPDFDVLDENESRTFIQRVVKELLVDAVRRGDLAARHLVSARGMHGASTYRPGAVEIVVGLIMELERGGHDAQWLVNATRATAEDRLSSGASVSRLARQLIDRIEELIDAGAAASEISRLKSEWPRYRRIIESFNGNCEPAAMLSDLRELTALFPEARKRAIKAEVKAIREILDKDDGRIGVKGLLIDEYGGVRAAPLMIATAELLNRIALTLSRRLSAESLVTFDGLINGALRLLNRTDIAARYRNELSALLVDEYQDVDRTQDLIVRLIAEPRDGLPTPALFIVGDEKQSIYGFRGADVAVFNTAREPEPAVLTLKQNRRSTPALLDFFNRLGARLMSADEDARIFRVAWGSEHDLAPVRPQGESPAIEIYLAKVNKDAEKRRSSELRATEAQALARWINSAVRSGMNVADPSGEETLHPASYRDIAILMRSFTDIQIYERALESAGIPFHTVRGRGFFACMEVRDVMSLLAAINDPDDAISLMAALRSPLFGVSDQALMDLAVLAAKVGKSVVRLLANPVPEFAESIAEREPLLTAWEIIRQLRAARTSLTVAELTEQALKLTGVEAVMLAQADGPQRAANLRKLVALARRHEERGIFALDDFVTTLRRLIDEPPLEPEAQILGETENVVRLMTIHQAKGLEFPIVIVADMGRKPRHQTLNYAISDEKGLLLRDSVGSGYDELPNRLLRDFEAIVKEREAAESARLLYVAVTRARDRLVLSEGAGESDWTRLIRTLVGAERMEEFLDNGEARHEVMIGDISVVLRRNGGEAPCPAESAISPPGFVDTTEFARLARERMSFTPRPGNEIVASPTALADFNRCPRQYLMRHRLGMPERPVSGKPAGDAVEMGIVAHAVLEQLGDGRNFCAADIRKAVEKYSRGTALDASACEELTGDIIRYASSDQDGKVIGREIPFFLRIESESTRLFLRGRIDLLLERERALVIRDFKYSRPDNSESEAWQIQMESYAAAVAAAYPDHQARAELVFLRGGLHLRPIELPERSHSRERLLRIARAIIDAAAANEYPMKPVSAYACRELGCGYVARCWRDGVAARG